MRTDLKTMADAVILAVKGLVTTVENSLSDRIDVLDAAIKAIPSGENGSDGKDGADGKEGSNGKDGQDGSNGKDGEPGLKGLDGKDGRDGVDGKDGVDGRSMTDEDVKRLLEPLVAQWGLDFERRAQGVLERAVERIPKPRDGTDGQDGMGFDDLSVEFDGERSFTIALIRGERRKTFDFMVPAVIDRGIYREGTEYEKGDGVTWAGSFWIAQEKTASKPDGDGWRLAVKRGRDGKDGRNGIDKTATVKT